MPSAKKKANEAHFYFFCGGMPAETFEVMSFRGTDEVSRPYQFTIRAISSNTDISPDNVVNKAATVYIHRDGEYFPYSGVVSEFRFVEMNADRATYLIKLVPKMWLLNLNRQTRIFQKISAPDIIKKVLDDANVTNYAIQNRGSFSQLEYEVQYQESDLNFISRLMETYGMWYFFTESPVLAEELDGSNGTEQLIITDDPSKFTFIDSGSDILYRSAQGMTEQVDQKDKEHIHLIQRNRQVIPKQVMFKDYNYRTPEVNLSGKKNVSGGDVGTVYQYGGNFKNTSEANALADIEAGRIASRKVVFEGSGNCSGLRAGKRFKLTEHPGDGFNDAYVALRVHHAGAHMSGSEGASVFTYANDFSGILASQADMFRPTERAVLPRINGIMTAQIEANGSDYASIDEKGRYKVRMPFDISDKKNYDASRYIRLAQPYSGANYGIHFPSHEGTEMVWACVDGDPNRPLGLATVPNANTLPPVVSNNQQQNVIRTAGSNELVMDDTDGKQKIRLTTKGKHVIEQDDENKKISIQTTDKNALILDDKNKKVAWNGDKHNITMDYGAKKITITSGGGHVICIDDDGKKITIQSKAGNMVEMDDSGKKITLTDANSKNTVTLDGSKGLILESQAKISISATQDLEIKAANIKMSTTSGKIDIKATQDLSLAGMKINEKATTDYKLEALNVGIKATMNAKMEGSLGVDIKSSLQTKIAGTMTELSGQAMTTVKGGIVMIN